MKRIVLAIGPSREVGGAQKVFLTTLKEFLKKDYEVSVIIPRGPLAEQIQSLNIRIHVINYSSLSGLLEISKILRNEDIDIVNTYLIKGSLLISFINLFYKKPICCTLLNAIIHEKTVRMQRLIYPFVYYMLSKICDGIIVNSEENKKHFMHVAKIDANFIKVIYSGIDIDEFLNIPDVKVKRDKFVLGVVGRLSIEKGHYYLIEALALLKTLDYTCIIIGDGPLRNKLETQVMLKGLQDKVKFHGFQHNVALVMQQMDAVIVPSLNETFGITIVEAFVLKKIVIASAVGGIPELVKHKNTGLLFPAKDISALTDAIAYVYNNKSETEQMVRNAYAFVLKNFTSSIMADATLAYYDLLKKYQKRGM